MPSQQERRRNNVRTGVFVTVTIALAVVTVVVLSGVWERLSRSTRDYRVSFPVVAGVSNLQAGAGVRVGGVALGRVTAVRPDITDGAFRRILVDFELARDVELFADAKVLVTSALLGAEAWLDVTDVGSVDRPLGPDDVITGTPAAGLLTTVLGPGNAARVDEMVGEAADTMTDTRAFGAFLAEIPDRWGPRLDTIVENVQASSADVRALTSDVRTQRWPAWADRVDEVLAWATRLTGAIDAAVVEGHDLVRDARHVVAENRPGIRTIVENTEQASADTRAITSSLRTDTLERFNTLIGTGQEGLDRATALLDQVTVDVDSWSVDVGEALANAMLASQQLKLTTAEVRRSPWKLLYRPAEKEFEHELLYDAARSFAVAAVDLKAAAASMERVLATHGDAIRQDPELYERITKNLLEPLRDYETAQQHLFDVLLTE